MTSKVFVEPFSVCLFLCTIITRLIQLASPVHNYYQYLILSHKNTHCYCFLNFTMYFSSNEATGKNNMNAWCGIIGINYVHMHFCRFLYGKGIAQEYIIVDLCTSLTVLLSTLFTYQNRNISKNVFKYFRYCGSY